MVRADLDTNVLISAVISDGRSRQVWTQAIQGRFQHLTSPAILDELERKLIGKFQYSPEEAGGVSVNVLSASELVESNLRFFAVPRDPKDNHILECAVAGRADLIVSGDQDLLSVACSTTSQSSLFERSPNHRPSTLTLRTRSIETTDEAF